jgi:hypothetical protein
VEDRQVLPVQRGQQAHRASQVPRVLPGPKDLLGQRVLPGLRARPDFKVLPDHKGCGASLDQRDRLDQRDHPVLKAIMAKLGRLDPLARPRPRRMPVFAASMQMARALRARQTKSLFPRFARMLAGRQLCKAGPCAAPEQPGSSGSACESSNERNVRPARTRIPFGKIRHRAARLRVVAQKTCRTELGRVVCANLHSIR